MRHDGKVAIVTGAAQGIGKACAERLFAEGASVVLADIQAELAGKVARSLDPDGPRAIALACDVGKRPQIAELIDTVVARHGRIDIMVNNAATSSTTPAMDLTEEELDRVLDVNLKGCFFGTQEAARVMQRQATGGSIVNMSSAQAELVIPDRVPYGISKAAINQITRIFAIALARQNIRVNAVGPGTILTPLVVGINRNEAAYRRILSRTPMGRVGRADEVSGIVSFLASEDASYITGQTIYADGGRAYLNYTVPVDDVLPELPLP
jgi:NAD(P)-dependent dehydrogenase (short-subunit alcohol dehydrogenase family)